MPVEQYSPETLLAAWEALGPSNSMSTELMDFCLAHLNRRLAENAVGPDAASAAKNEGQVDVFAMELPPPSRFQRRNGRSRNESTKSPPGPAMELFSTFNHASKLWSIPCGPQEGETYQQIAACPTY
jgi:hypothetical protein